MDNQGSVISLFSGALGLDLGLEQAGFSIRVALEPNRYAAATIEENRPNLVLLKKRIEDVATHEILAAADLKVGEATILSGGPSCQPFSTAGGRGSMADPRGVLFREFLRVVVEARPRFFLMENVRGVLSSAVRHRPLDQRGPGFPLPTSDEELGSGLIMILEELKATGYSVVFDVLNAADFGVPQARERVVFIGSRDGEWVDLPDPTHSKVGGGGLPKWRTLREAMQDLDDPDPSFREFSPPKKELVALIPPGGNWRDLPTELQRKALGKAADSWGGRSGFMRRLAWDRPSPSVTTRPDGKATMFCHPSEDRPLSVREFAALQQFPKDWRFMGGPAQQYLQLGNAVPVGLGRAVGEAIAYALEGTVRRPAPPIRTSEELLAKLARRPTTVLNPPRMRSDAGGRSSIQRWRDGAPGTYRTGVADLIARSTAAASAGNE